MSTNQSFTSEIRGTSLPESQIGLEDLVGTKMRCCYKWVIRLIFIDARAIVSPPPMPAPLLLLYSITHYRLLGAALRDLCHLRQRSYQCSRLSPSFGPNVREWSKCSDYHSQSMLGIRNQRIRNSRVIVIILFIPGLQGVGILRTRLWPG